jgi:3-hydroxy-9,10-secoandrosta-1,3,5(10)-triene-9,17-dione monooxygenase
VLFFCRNGPAATTKVAAQRITQMWSGARTKLLSCAFRTEHFLGHEKLCDKASEKDAAGAMTKVEHLRAGNSHEAVLARVRALIPTIRAGAAAAEEARTLPQETVDALLAAGLARILVPASCGGYGLSLDTWFEVVREIARADASHAWCASLMIHHPHYLSHFPEAAQNAVWAEGVDFAIAASIQPVGRVTAVEGGYRISGEFPFASGINYSRWLIVGSIAEGSGGPEAKFFLVRPNEFEIKDTWFTAAMQATGSNTAVCSEVFVPESHTLALSDLREGRTPGSKLHDGPIYRAPWISYAPLTFVTPMLGAAQGAYEFFREWTINRPPVRGGHPVAQITSVQVRLGRIGADLDAAELLLRRAVEVACAFDPPSMQLRARTMRDCARAAELCVEAIDTLIAMSGTAGFGASHPLQRAWRDIHFAAMHVALNREQNFAHFGRLALGLERDPHLPFF